MNSLTMKKWWGIAICGMGLVLAGLAEDALPAAYERLEAVESSGTQYIDTGYVPRAATPFVFEMAGAYTSLTANYQLMGELSSDKVQRYDFGINKQNKFIITTSAGGTAADLREHRFVVNFATGVFTMDGTTVATGAANSKDANLNFYLFARRNWNGTSTTPNCQSRFRMRACRLLQGGLVVRDFVPARRRSDKVIGLFDLVENVFYAPAGGALAGYDYVPNLYLNYIETDGTQYINTNYKAIGTTPFAFELKGAWTQLRSSYQLFGSLEDGKARYDFGMHKNGVWTLGATLSNVTADTNEHTFTGNFTTGVMAVDGITVLTDPKPLLANATRTFYLFNRQNANGGVTCPSWFRLRSCKLTQNGTAVRDMVAGLSTNGVAGVWDRVEGKHYPKSAGSNFTWGYGYLETDNGESVHVGTLTPADMTPTRDFEKEGFRSVSAAAVTRFPAALTLSRGELSFADGTARTIEVVGALTFRGGAAVKIDVTDSAVDAFQAGALVFDASATVENPVIVQVNDVAAQGALAAGTVFPFLSVAGTTLTAADAEKFRVKGLKAEVAAENGALVLRARTTGTAEWTGAAGDGRWSTPGNWLNDTPPQRGWAVRFTPSEGGTTTMDIPGLCTTSVEAGPTAGTFVHGGTTMLTVEGGLTNSTTATQMYTVPMTIGSEFDTPFTFSAVGDLVVTGALKDVASPILVKSGNGVLRLNDEVVAKATNVTVEAGIMRLERTGRVKAASAGGEIFVRAGAQLDFNVSNAGDSISHNEVTHGKTFHIAGNGPDGSVGAIDNSSLVTSWGCNFGKIILDADAKIGGGWMAIRPLTGSALSDLSVEGPHTLTVCNTNLFLIRATTMALDRLDLKGIISFEASVSGAITNGVHCFAGAFCRLTSGVNIPEQMPIVMEENGATLRCDGGNSASAGAVVVKPGVSTTFKCEKTLTLSGAVTNEGAVAQTDVDALILTGTLSGNGSFTGAKVRFGGTASSWEIEVNDVGAERMVDFNGVDDPSLFIGLKALNVRTTGTATALQTVDIGPAGTLTERQAADIALTVETEQGVAVPNCHLDVVSGRLVLTLRDAALVRTAEWAGAGTDPTNFADPENWNCRNDLGETLDRALPLDHTIIVITPMSVFSCPAQTPLTYLNVRFAEGASLGADCDWSGLDLTRILPDGTLDLAGHDLNVTARANLAVAYTVTDSTESGGTLRITVPEGVTVLNDALALTGSLRLATTGAGTFDARRFNQTYTGGTEVEGGTLTLRLSGSTSGTYSPKNRIFGAQGSEIQVDAGATFDTKGNYDFYQHRIVLNGGTLVNAGCDMSKRPSDGYGCTGGLTLLADSSLICTYSLRHGEGVIDLGGHTLEVSIAANKYWHLDGTSTLSNGTVRVTGGGSFNTLAIIKEARTANVEMGTAMSLNSEARISVNDFKMTYTGSVRGSGTGGVDIYGTYAPVTDYTYNYVLQNGATLDLAGKSAAWDVTGLQLGFVANSRVDILMPPPSVVKSGDYVVTWEEGKAPANVDTVTFKAKGEKGTLLQVKSTGILVRRGFTILVR